MSTSISRRKFIGVAAGATGAAALGPLAPGAVAHGKHRGRGGNRLLPKDRIAVQLFTLRNRIGDLGFEQVFSELAEIGYKWVEFAGYGAPDTNVPNPNPRPATIPDLEKLRTFLKRYRLKGIGSHIGVTQFRDNLEQVLDDAETLGLRYIGTASEPDQLFPPAERQTVDAYRRAAEAYNGFGAAAKARGMRFYHHNHSSEFAVVDGTRLYDVLMEETDPRLVFFQLDIFWAYVGATGAPAVTTPTGMKSWFPNFDPIELVWNQPERFPLFHAKDGVPDGGRHADQIRMAVHRPRRRQRAALGALQRARDGRALLHRRARRPQLPGACSCPRRRAKRGPAADC